MADAGITEGLMISCPRLFVATALAVALAVPAQAGEPANRLRHHIDQVIRIIQEPEPSMPAAAQPRRAAIRKVAENLFDLRETTKRCLGTHWQARTADEREEIVRLFGDLLERSYISKVELYNGEKVMILNDSIDGEYATVRTRVVTRQGGEFAVDYRMLERNGTWYAYDVVIEGVSLIANYRAQFNRVIQASSYQDLVRKLRLKQDGTVAGKTSF